jgi:nanoRNase/pAp phosphatase (c-di-AMP/oligoRNAs hydrolase)
MTNEPIDQTLNQFRKASNVLILVSGGQNIDSISAGFAIKEFLAKHDKRSLVMGNMPMTTRFGFLSDAQLAAPTTLTKNLVVEISLQKTDLSELTYQKHDQKLAIFLTPKSGQFESSDVTIKNAVYPYDLIVTLGITNLEELGELYSKHAQMFFDIPLVNIDYRAANESYGQINLVSLTSSAVSEVVYDVLNQYDPNFIDEKIATLLLAGLVAQTNSFQSQKTTPQVFAKASKLISLGGKQQEIVSQLYKSKSLGLLRLWGRVLTGLKHDVPNQIVYSAVSAADIERSEAALADLDEIIFEMIQQLGFAKWFLLLVEKGAETTVYVSGTGPINLLNLFASYRPTTLAPQVYKFTTARTLTAAEPEILGTIQQELVKYQG